MLAMIDRWGVPRGGSVESLAAWLDHIGLSQYAPVLEANAFDIATAGRLSDADLQRFGIREREHRRLLLEAISALPPRRKLTGRMLSDRRPLTILFCDLVDSTALSAKLDPEDLASLVVDYQRACAAAVARFDGFVARYVGDGILVYFGYPNAHEDSAERAVRSALAVLQAVARIRTAPGIRLQVRIGIATGPVVVGSLPGSDSVDRHAVVGETPNLAARLHAAAEANSILIASSTHQRIASLFECVEVGPISLKGLPSAIKAFRVLGERGFVGRFEARRASGLTPYCGRTAELAALAAHWRSACAGAGKVALIKGEAGIGKSRLVQEFLDRLVESEHRRIEFVGSPFSRNSPLHPIITQLARAAGFAHDDSAQRKREKLDAILSREPAAAAGAMAAIFASLLSLPPMPHDPPRDPDAYRHKRRTLEAILSRIAAFALEQPVLLLCEDAQWFDPTTRELLDALVAKSASSAIFMIVTCRPEFQSNWLRFGHAGELSLQRLDRDIAAAMIGEVVQRRVGLPPGLMCEIVERSGGNPLYIEELTRAVLDANLAVAEPDAASILAIPDTLQELLIARLHQAAPAREVAQIGAAIGREFSQELLAAVATVEPVKLSATLGRLVHSDLLYRRASSAGAAYVFKHDLIQEAAYETLLFAQRRDLHRRIALALESRFPATVESQPELLAEHWERSEAFETAIRYRRLAGERAAARSAASEADVHLHRAFNLIKRLPKGRERTQLATDISVRHGGVLRVLSGPPAPATGRMFKRARRLCRQTADDRLLVPALSGLFAYYFVRAENSRAAATAHELLAFAEERKSRLYRMIGHRTLGMVQMHTGQLLAARQNLERSMSLYDESEDGALAFLYGTDHAQTATGFLAKALWLLGLPDAAAAREVWAMAHAVKVNHLFSLMQGMMFRTTVRLFARDWDGAAALAKEVSDQAARHSIGFAANFSAFCLAACRAVRSPDRAAVEEMQATANAWGKLNYRPLFLALIAEAMARAGNPDGGLDQLAKARALVAATDERWVEPELYRLCGVLELMRDTTAVDTGETLFRQGIALAREQASRSYELRCSVSLSHLLKSCGRVAEANAALAPVYDGFVEGLDTSDLEEARNALRQF
jgi:class 3 adenylate cyclase